MPGKGNRNKHTGTRPVNKEEKQVASVAIFSEETKETPPPKTNTAQELLDRS